MSKRQIAVRVLDWGSNAALCLIVLAVVAVLLAPHFTGWRYGILRSGSMSPGMPTGSAIVVEPVGGQTMQPGDVITFHSGVNSGLLITHRVVEVTQANGHTAYRTKGDANNAPDTDLVAPSQVIGRVIFEVPKIGLALRFFHNRFGFIFLIAVPAALIVGMELRELVAGLKDLRHKRKAEA
jgi:signal peptidase